MSLLKNTLIDYEAAIAPDGSPAGPAALAPAPAAPAAPAAAPAAPAGWLPSSQEELEQIVAGTAAQATRQVLGEYAQQPQQYQQPEPQFDPYEGFDPFDPRTIDAIAQMRAEQLLVETLGPFAERVLPMVEAQERAQGEAIAKHQLASLTTELGAFDQQHAAARAVVLVQQGQPPEQALRQAATEVRAHEQAQRSAWEAERAAQLQNMHGQLQQPPAGLAAGAQIVEVPKGPNRYHEQLQRSRMAAGMIPGVQQ